MNEIRNSNLNVEEEFFCLKFELNALSNLTVKGKAERWVPGYIWNNNEDEHSSRYNLAIRYVKNKKVLDIACGSGYGSYLLAEKGEALEVRACDLDEDAIRYGNARYYHPKVTRSVQDAEKFKIDNYFDVAVSFETIEHLDNYLGLLQNIYASLKPDGLLLISTPIVEKTRTECYNPYHKIEWSFDDFQQLIGKLFSIEQTYVQSVRLKEKETTRVERILNRVVNKFRPSTKAAVTINPFPVQYNHNLSNHIIIEGYQIIVCKKKANS